MKLPSIRLFVSRLRLPCSLLATASLSVMLSAQTATPAPASASNADVIELSPFVVNSSADVGYAANNTLAGSRLRTNLSDIANAVSVFTPEFMSDINASSEADIMKYSASAVPERTDQTPGAQGISIDTGGFQFRVRGQLASRARNYFGTSLVPDAYNSDRFEEARGPNAILFGLGGAGGILNITTKRALTNKDSTQLKVVVGSDSQLRTTIDHNEAINEKLAFRVNGLFEDADGWHPHDFLKQERLHLALTFRPWRKTTIRAEAEWGDVTNTLTRNFAPFDNVSLWRLQGSPTVPGLAAANAALGINKRNATPRVTYIGNSASFQNFQQTVFSAPQVATNNTGITESFWETFDATNPYPKDANFGGPGALSDYTQKSYSVFFESEPVENLFIEFAANADQRNHEVFDTTHEVNRILGEPGTTFRDGTPNPYAGMYYIDTRWVLRSEKNAAERYRATASYQLDFGKFGRHNFAALASRDNTENPRFVGFLVLDGSPFNAQPQNAANQVWTRNYVADATQLSQFSAPDFRLLPEQISVVMNAGAAPSTFATTWANNELNDQWQHLKEYLVSWQGYFFNDRIVATAGIRHSSRDAFSRPTNNPNNQTTPDSSGALRFLDRPVSVESFSFDRKSYGVVAKATSWLSGYYNFSENGQIPGTTQFLIPNNRAFPLNSGEGEDYGVMLNLLQGRVVARLGYFTTASVDQASAFGANNVSVRNDRINNALIAASRPAANNLVAVGGDFDLADVKADGYELNLTANLTESWRLIFSGSKSNVVTSNMLKQSRPFAAQVVPTWEALSAADKSINTTAGVSIAQEIINYQTWLNSTTAVEGRSTIGQRELELRVFTRYDIRRAVLKGIFVGGGFRYGSAPVVGVNTAGQYFYSPINREVDLLLGYKRRLSGRFNKMNLEIQLNAQSILQQEDYTFLRINPDGQLFRVQINAPARYTLTTTLNF